MLQSVSISVLEVELPMPVRYFIHYPQIIHTAFRGAVYPIAMNPARAFDLPGSTFSGLPVLIFSRITCMVKGNRNSTSHA